MSQVTLTTFGASYFHMDIVGHEGAACNRFQVRIYPSHRRDTAMELDLSPQQLGDQIVALALIYAFIHDVLGAVAWWRLFVDSRLTRLYGLPVVLRSEDMP